MELNHLSTFSGIEGFGLGAKYAGIQNVASIEINPHKQKIIRKHFNHPIFEDVKNTTGKKIQKRVSQKVHILSGGFPCPDISPAGKGAGIFGATASLWGSIPRLAKELNCEHILIENSPRLTRKGLEKILYDLSKVGYDAEWECISNSAFGLPHQRRRIYIIAHSNQNRRNKEICTVSQKCFQHIETKKYKMLDQSSHPFLRFEERYGESPVWGVYDGLSKRLDVSRRLEALGDSVSPIVAWYLFECIKLYRERYIS